MARVINFPATNPRRKIAKVITLSPVLAIDQEKTLDSRLGGYRWQMRLSIEPRDLQRIIKEANQMGRDGIELRGFGFNVDSNEIML